MIKWSNGTVWIKEESGAASGCAVDSYLGTYRNESSGTVITIEEADGEVTVNNPGYPQTKPIEEFVDENGTAHYYGHEGAATMDCRKVIPPQLGQNDVCTHHDAYTHHNAYTHYDACTHQDAYT